MWSGLGAPIATRRVRGVIPARANVRRVAEPQPGIRDDPVELFDERIFRKRRQLVEPELGAAHIRAERLAVVRRLGDRVRE
jgi:hypothetical protein